MKRLLRSVMVLLSEKAVGNSKIHQLLGGGGGT